jgi:hypothetical protein
LQGPSVLGAGFVLAGVLAAGFVAAGDLGVGFVAASVLAGRVGAVPE